MTPKVLFAGPADHWDIYRTALTRAFAQAGLEVDLATDHPPAEVDYIVHAPTGPVSDFAPFTACKAVLGLWAGVETVVGNLTLTQPFARLVDPGLEQGMVEWVVAHTLRAHLDLDRYILGQDGTWLRADHCLAADRPVTVLGFGALGRACGTALARLGFPVTGWSARPKDVEGIRCLHGEAGLTEALTGAQIIILLLPHTSQTENILNARTLALPARGATVLNPGRGALIDDAALLAALDSGQIGQATLDVFRIEPLPRDHPYWAHPRVTVTPHIAAETRPATASRVIAENVRRSEAGEPLLHLVDRSRGY